MIDPSDHEVAVFSTARGLAGGERAAYLDQACGADAALRQSVEVLLRAHEEAGAFLARPAPGAELSPKLPSGPSGRNSFPAPAEKPGDRIGRYKLLQQIGEGGCGVVYMAEQEEPVHRRVAIKVIKLGMDTKNVIARFEAEQQALALMEHPNIAKVLDAGATEAGRPYFVMELVRGVKITDYCDQDNLNTRERLNLFIQVCRAIQHAHQKGVIHRDIKPSNILVTMNDGVPLPKVIDFGIAKATQGKLTDRTVFTAFEQFIGTPAYMSPEQAEMSARDVDTRSDIYSLGVLLYELLTGQTPFDAKKLLQGGLDEIRRTIRQEEPARPSTRLSTMQGADLTAIAKHRKADAPKLVHLVRGDLDWIVMKALEKDRTRRYQTANGLATDVQRHLNDEPIVARPPSRLYLLQKLARRNRLAAAAAASVAVALTIGLAASTWMLVKEREARRRTVAAERVQSQLRERADKASAEAKATLDASDFSQAVRLAAEDNNGEALAYLVRILSKNPANGAALMRLTTLLTYHSWMVPTLGLAHLDTVSSARFSPDGQWIATGSWDQTARVWDARSGLPVGAPMRHSGILQLVESVNFSPDGKSIVTASEDNTARVWDACTGLPQTPPLTHEATVRSARFSPDGKRVVTASQDGTARVWDAANGRLLAGPLKHEGWVVAAEFSPEAKRIVTASYDNQARVWDAQSGQLLAPPMKHNGWVNTAQFSPNGEQVLTASYDGTARVWDAQSGQPLTPPSRHANRVKSAQFSPDGRRFVTASFDNTARVWDARTGLALTVPLLHSKPVMSAQFSPDGMRILTTSWDRTARIWDSHTGAPLSEPMKHRAALMSGQFSPDAKRVATAGYDGKVLVWDAQNSPALNEPLEHKGKVWSAHFSPEGTRIVTASEDHTARVWEALTGQPVGQPLNHGAAVRSAQFSPDGKWILTASMDKSARVWDAQTAQPLTEPMNHDATVRTASFSPDGQQVVTASEDSTARVWDARSGRPLTKALKHQGWVYSATFSPDGSRVVTAASDGVARVWDAHSGRLLAECLGHSRALESARFSPDGKRILTVSYDSTAREWDAATGQPLGEPLRHENAVLWVQFSPEGKRIVTASADQKARVWDYITGQTLTPPLEHSGGVNSAQFSHDGRWIVTASDDFTARVWDAQTGRPLSDPLLHRAGVRWAEFSPDGKRVVTVADDQAAHIWDVAPVPASCPDWLLPLAEAVSGLALNPQGILQETKTNRVETLKQIRQRLDGDASGDGWVVWGRWFLADADQRTLSPFSNTKLQTSTKRAVDEPVGETSKESKLADDLAEAESIARAALAHNRRLWPQDPAKWQSELKNLAAVLRRQLRFEEALELLKNAPSPVPSSNLLQNGSFELGSFSVANVMGLSPGGGESGGDCLRLLAGDGKIVGWQVVGPPSADVSWIGPDNPFGLSAADGNFCLDLTGFHDVAPYGGVAQNFPTIIGQVYALSFEIGSETSWDHSILPSVALAITGNPATLHTVSSVGYNHWQTFKLNFTATTTNTTLTFTGGNTNNLAYIGLDNVTVTPAEDAASNQRKPESP